MPRFTSYRQYDAMDCGPTCLRMGAFSLDERMNVFDFRRGRITGSMNDGESLPAVQVVTLSQLLSN